ncbi:MAG: NFACT RNA binding domain-containing protein [Evtepia sp.]|uniref:Rqc2 family fibronectin-binding protein n=1 Tax=Evtepia sp. TaxID=2773933 RepID=UPI002A755CFF|nr:NFACT RNA binding domain-containing protein [Evtepia sp.]MDY3015023.1 NFACT RNA binding domain-containing protein [Evtepia sp.]
MAMDALCLSAVLREVDQAATGGRIDKIYQPSRDEILLQVRGTAGACRVLLSANPARPRIQLTELPRENPAEPPMFCMLLRKYLTGEKILSLRQPPMERLVEMVVEATNEMGDKVERRLVLEAMGRRANLVLLDGENRIVDCLRRVGGDLTQSRPLLPGMFYQLPPAQAGKYRPDALDEESRRELVESSKGDTPADRFLLDHFAGISPLVAREAAFEAFGEVDAPVERGVETLLDKLTALVEKAAAGENQPTLLMREGQPVDFSFRPILQYGPTTESVEKESFSALLDGFYHAKETAEQVRQKGQDFIKSLTHARDRLARKMALQEKELEGTKDREHDRMCGDLITANLYRMEKGSRRLVTENFYDPECREIEIPLDPLKTPQQNAARYYKAYTKAKRAEEMLTIQLEKGREEMAYLESVLDSISRAEGDRDLEEIRQELVSTGYLRRRGKAKERMKRPGTKPMEFRSSSGLRISVGRNNLQNDQLTTKQAGKWDYWFHTQKIHGSHVILWTEGEEPDETSLQEAAQLAAWFSQGREGKKIPVDYTPVKYVKKPAGSRPGMVIYTTYQTAYVDPDEQLAERLKIKK